MPLVYDHGMSTTKRVSYKGRRYPSIIMYKEDIAARKINEVYWKKAYGLPYADVLRLLQRAEAKSIKETGKSLTEK